MSSSTHLDSYFSRFPSRSYRKRSPIINAGDILQKIYFLKKGYIRLYSISNEGKELTLIIYKPGNVFPLLIALQPSTPYPYWVETITQAEVILVPVTSFISFFKNNPDLLLNLSVEIMSRLDSALRRMEYMAFGNAYVKVASILVLAAQRFGRIENRNIIIDVPLTHKDIGLLIAATRETVSSEIKKLEKKKIIGYKGRLIAIKNVQLLKKEALLNDSY